jgi:transposase
LSNYLVEYPSAKAVTVARLFKVSLATVYQRKAKLKTAASKAKQDKWARKNRPSTLVPNGIASMALYAEDKVNHPSHYKVGGIETIDFIEAKELDYHLGNVVKYISRADHKDEKLENLKKAQWYLNRAVTNLEKK